MGLIQGTVSQNGEHFRAWIYWVLNSQDLINNRSNISVEVLIDTTNTAYDWDGNCSSFKLSVDTNAWAPGSFNSDNTSGWTYSAANSPTGRAAQRIWNKQTVDIQHNADGTKSINLSSSFSLNSGGYGPGNVSISGNVTLPSIPRSSDVTAFSFENGKIGTNLSASLDIKLPDTTHTLALKLGATTIKTWTGITTAENALTLTQNELNAIYNAMPNSTTATFTMACDTYSGVTKIGDTRTKTVAASIDTAVIKPSLGSFTADEAVASVKAIMGAGKYVQKLSKITFAVAGAAASMGATIASHKVVFDNMTYIINTGETSSSVTTDFVNNIGTITATATVTDSRGLTASISIQITVLAYNPPQITAFTVARCAQDGSDDPLGEYVRVKCQGSAVSLINVTEKNTLTYILYSKLRTEESFTQQKSTTIAGVVLDTTLAPDILSPYAGTDSFDFELIVIDAFGNLDLALSSLATAQSALSLGKDGVGVNKVYEPEVEGKLQVGGDINEDGTLLKDKYAPISCSTTVQHPDGTDANTILTNGWHEVLNPVNGVTGLTLHKIFVIASNDGAYVTQIASSAIENPNCLWTRSLHGGTWDAWDQLVTTSMQKYKTTVVTRSANVYNAQSINLGFRPKFVRIRAGFSVSTQYDSDGAYDGTTGAVVVKCGASNVTASYTGYLVIIHTGSQTNQATAAFTDTGLTLTWTKGGTSDIPAGTIHMMIEAWG
jgi:hypothetical protein